MCGGLRWELDLTRKVGGAIYDVLYYGYIPESEFGRSWLSETGDARLAKKYNLKEEIVNVLYIHFDSEHREWRNWLLNCI